MVEIPGASSLGAGPSARSGRAIARPETGQIAAGVAAAAGGVQQLGQASLRLATTVAARAQQVEDYQVQARWLDYQQQAATRYDEEMRGLAADQLEGYASGFLDEGGTFYDEGRAFMESIPERLRPEYNTRLMGFRNQLFDSANQYALSQLNAISVTTMNDAVTAILNQIPQAAAAPDPSGAAGTLIEQARSVITGAPHLTQAQQAEALSNATRNINLALTSELTRTGQFDLVDQMLGADPVAMSSRVLDAAGGAGTISDGQWVAVAGDVLRAGMTVDEIEVFDADPTTARSSILAARNDPDVVAEVAARIQDQNGRALASVGIDATPGNLMLAQALGVPAAIVVARRAETSPDTPVADIVPASVLPDAMRSMTAGEAAAWAESEVTATPAYGHRMAAGLTLDDRAALIADNQRGRAAAATAAAAQQQAEYATRFNDLKNGLNDGRLGLADINAARQAGWLTDADDIRQAQSIYRERNGEMADAAEGLRLIADPNYQFSSFNSDDRDRVDAAYRVMGGAGTLLDPSAAPDEQQQAVQVLRAVVDRTGIIPQSALEALQGGIYSTNRGVRDAAFTVLDSLANDHPTVVNLALNDQQFGRLLDWQALSPLMTSEELDVRFSPNADPQTEARMERLRGDGADLAADIPLGEIVNHFIRGTFGASVNSYPVTNEQAVAMQDDFTAAFADRYAATGNEATAKEQAFAMLERKWGVTDVGNTRRVMAYPPELYYGQIGGSFDWLDADVQQQIEAAIGMDASGVEYGLIAAPGLIEGELPAYYIHYTNPATGEVGTLAGDNGTGYLFDREAALSTWRQTFDAERAAAQRPASYLFGPNGEIIPNPDASVAPSIGRVLPGAQAITGPTIPATGTRALPGTQQIGTPVENLGAAGRGGLRLQ